jgi:hypothetical protein
MKPYEQSWKQHMEANNRKHTSNYTPVIRARVQCPMKTLTREFVTERKTVYEFHVCILKTQTTGQWFIQHQRVRENVDVKLSIGTDTQGLKKRYYARMNVQDVSMLNDTTRTH